jgi:alkylation response protein AidB-like acyl-CoA dehydrogenase
MRRDAPASGRCPQFTEDHEAFRGLARGFIGKEVVPAYPQCARVKLFCTEMQARVVDRCLQLFGGYGYMMEYPIARLYTDARVARIYAGTSEVIKVIIAKSLGL